MCSSFLPENERKIKIYVFNNFFTICLNDETHIVKNYKIKNYGIDIDWLDEVTEFNITLTAKKSDFEVVEDLDTAISENIKKDEILDLLYMKVKKDLNKRGK